MKITLIEVKNYKRLEYISIAPGDRNIVLIAGKNRQGKSSLIGAMSAAIGGGKEAAEEPIRKGQKRADIKIEYDGELVVHRKFLASGASTLEIKNKVGTLSKPQQVLDKLIGSRFLNPLEFMRLAEKKQRDVLIQCASIDLDLDAHAKKRKSVFDERTNANRDLKRYTAELDSLPDPGEIPEVTSPDELLAKLEALTAKEAEKEKAKSTLGVMRAEAVRGKNRVDDLKRQLEGAEKAYETFVKDGKVQLAKAEELAKEDHAEEIDKTKEELKTANAANEERVRRVALLERETNATTSLGEASMEIDRLNAELEELDKIKATALAEAKMPIKGLDVDEDRVVYKGVPLSQASGAEQLQVSLALAAAMSPELKDIWVEDGALLDQESLDQVHAFAINSDLRVWLERVGESDDDCIIIEEGRIKGASTDKHAGESADQTVPG
jgi:hypothetical protein